MDAFAQIPLQSAQGGFLRSTQSFSSSRIHFVGVRGFQSSRICSLNGSASSFEPSNQEDDPDEPPKSKQDATQVSSSEITLLCEKLLVLLVLRLCCSCPAVL